MPKKLSHKKSLELEVAGLKVKLGIALRKIDELEHLLAEAAKHESPWQIIKTWYAKI
jgi:hypothetical protein